MPQRSRKPRPKVICVQCGEMKHTGGNLRCGKCRAVVRTCATCGKEFRSEYRNCTACRSRERSCTGCGSVFRGTTRLCGQCRSSDRTCNVCGDAFFGYGRKCNSCRHAGERACSQCGKAIRGNTKCSACSRKTRTCDGCGLLIKSARRKCYYCRGVERDCRDCGRAFIGDSPLCSPCRGRRYKTRAESAVASHARRSELLPSVPRPTSRAILKEGPCVYCGAEATDVDHIVPVVRGGTNHPDNLVPSCHTCNLSKGNRLLTRWHRARVRQGMLSSSKVAFVYSVQAALASEGDEHTQPATDLPGFPSI